MVDDGSSDATAESISREFPWVRVLRNERSQHFTAAANRGLAAARGDLILLLNSDTEVDPDALGQLRRAFERDPRLGIVGATLRYPDGSPQWSGGPEPGLSWFFAKSSGAGKLLARLRRCATRHRTRGVIASHSGEPSRHEVDWVSGAALAVRRRVLSRVGLLDTRFEVYAQDLDLCLAARDAGWLVAVVPEVRVMHHHGATISRDRERSPGREDIFKVWSDLFTWARKRRGEQWTRRVLRVVWLGTALRLAMFRLRALPGLQRSPGRREADVYGRVLEWLTARLRRTG